MENIWRSVLAGCTVEDSRITPVRLYPISLGIQKPRSQKEVSILLHDSAALEYLARLSQPFGADLRIENDVGCLDL